MKMEKIKELEEKNAQAELGGGKERIKKQHEKGKLTARERLALLLDEGSFVELDKFVVHRLSEFGMEKNKIAGDGVVTGYGTIDGRLVFVYAQDFTILGGSLGEMHGEKICKVMDMAMRQGAPIIGLNDSGGARVQEGALSLGAYGEIFKRNTHASGVVPQISVIMGPCAGGAVYSPAVTDFIFMVKDTSHMFITGPNVIKTVTGEEITFDALGGAMAHASISGVCDFTPESEEECISQVRTLLSYLPSNNLDDPPFAPSTDDPGRMEEALNTIIPDDPNKPYNMREVIQHVVDKDSLFESKIQYAPNAITAFARLNGMPVGIIANNPMQLAGVLDINASDKISRFVRFCDAFNLPVITFQACPGFLPGVNQEHGGIIRHGAKILFAYAEATVPLITVIVTKAIGGAYVVLGSKNIGADIVMAWPTTELAVMGAEGAANIIFRKEIAASDDPKTTRQEKIDEYRNRFANPYVAAELGIIDMVIEPKETRLRLIETLGMLRDKRTARPPKKHGNIPV
ncbi:MAG: acyl-CoA carboxylase subunit beta [Promethearchaeota archaeon]